MDSNETKVIESRVLHRFVQPIAYYEEGGAYYNQVIGLNTQAYSVYDRADKSGIYVVYGDGSHTYTEIRDGKSSIGYCKEYPVFSEEFVNLINEKAEKSDTYTKNEVDAIVSSVYKPKGSVATKADLPKTGNKVGDVYDVLEDSMNYVWTISDKWDPLGPIIDLTSYAKLTDLAAETDRAILAEGIINDRITNVAESLEETDRTHTEAINGLATECERLDEEKAGVQTVSQLIRNSEANTKEYVDSQVSVIENLIPDKVSELENDVPYLTEHQSLENYPTKAEMQTADNEAKKDVLKRIWSKPTDPDNGYFYSKYTKNDGSYALVFNESDGGGVQFYNKSLNSLQFVGVNDGSDGVYTQIYAKNKTTNIGARLASSPSGMFYTNGKANGSYTANDELITKGNLNDAVSVKANSADVYTKAEIDSKLTASMHFKGTKNTYNDLPKTDNAVGDMWNILTTGDNYAWDGSNWDKLSETIDLSIYALKTDLENEELRAKGVENTKADKTDTYTKLEVDAKNKNIKDEIYGHIWSKPLDPAHGYFNTKYVADNGSFALMFNENDGGGAQVFDKTANVISYVGANLEEGQSDKDSAVNIQIYSKDRTTNEGVRINVNAQKAYYLKGANKTNVAERELATLEDMPSKTSDLTNDSDFTTNEALQAQVQSLTEQINTLKLLIPQEVFDPTTARTALNKSGKVTLCSDIDLGKLNIGAGIFANNDTYVNLNGYTLQAGPSGSRPLLLARGTAKYTFNGSGQVIDTAIDSSPIWCASETASITINNGTFIAEGHTETIYCELGTITINGGIFKTDAEDKRYVLNCKDANFAAGTAKIIVKGGEFWDFDPSANPEGPDTSYVADGYTVTSREEDGHIIYTVVKA